MKAQSRCDIECHGILVSIQIPRDPPPMLRHAGQLNSSHSANMQIKTVKTLNIGTPRPATLVVLNIKQFNFTRK